MEPRLPSQAIDSLDPESGDDRGNEEEEREERDDGQADSQADDHADGQVEAARLPHLMDMVTDDGGEAARLPHLTDMVTEFVIAINGQENAVLCSGSVIDLQRKVSEATQAGLALTTTAKNAPSDPAAPSVHCEHTRRSRSAAVRQP
jgi:hypothetical protein